MKVYISSEAQMKMFEITKHDTFENGGLLYGRMNPKWIQIHDVSDAGPNASRSRSQVVFDKEYLMAYTVKQLALDFFIVGTWHSHPNGVTNRPSSTDLQTMRSLSSLYRGLVLPVFAIVEQRDYELSVRYYSVEICDNTYREIQSFLNEGDL